MKAPATAVEIRELSELDDLWAASRLFDDLWQRSTPAVPPELLRAITHAGSYAAGAYAHGRLVGAGVGFLGRHEGRDCLHSHIVGVVPEMQGQGVGFAIKQHQRRWARAAGIPVVTWTFDPLVRRNAAFNLGRLGARAVAYHPNFYGRMNDGFNVNEDTDRLFVVWPSEPGSPGLQEAQALPLEAATIMLDEDDRGGPVLQEVEGPLLRCRIPADIVALRRADPGLGWAWRLALRQALCGLLDAGGTIETATPDGWYLLRAPAGAPAWPSVAPATGSTTP
jgi:predicted GNAT superfamily acetyltransferase